METFDLHSLIVEELAEVLAQTYQTSSIPPNNEALLDDSVIQRLLAQCPPLPASRKGEQTDICNVVGRRQENGVLGLAKLVSQSKSNQVRTALLDILLAYLEALPRYTYRFEATFKINDPTTDEDVSGERRFAERLVERLLECAAQAPESAPLIMERVWRHFNSLLDIIESKDGAERAAMVCLPALLGSLSAIEKTSFRFRASDVFMADTLSTRLVSKSMIGGIRAATAAASLKRHRKQSVVLNSHVLAQFLSALRAVLESRVAAQLVEGGRLDADSVSQMNAQQLWDAISKLDNSSNSQSTTESNSAINNHNSELHATFKRILAFSMQAYSESRASTLHAESVSIMCRSVYVGALACMLEGRLESRLAKAVFEHIRSDAVQSVSALNVACFRVLEAVAGFFPESRSYIAAATTDFISSPPSCLDTALPSSGRLSQEERVILAPAAATLVACMRPASASSHRTISTTHTLFNSLATNASLRVSRNVLVVLARLALILRDAEVTELVVSMVCAPRFVGSPPLLALAVQCASAVAAVADNLIVSDVVAAALKRITFGNRSSDEDAACAATGNSLAELANDVKDRADVVDGFFCAVMRSFVDASVEWPSPPHFKRRLVTPLSVFLPILHVLVTADAYSIGSDPSAEHVELWRNFWLHMVVRGYATERSYITVYGSIYATLAAKSPILVHPSSVNYLETEVEYSSVLQRENADTSLSQIRNALDPIISHHSQPLLRNISFPHAAFLLAVYNVEVARATASGDCTAVLKYFSNSAVTSSTLLQAFESIANLTITAYVRETTSKKWSIEASLAGNSYTNAPLRVMAQVRELMVASCHHLELVSQWAQRFVDKILRAFPQCLLDKTVICTLLELVQLVWKSCKAEQDDQFVPVYWFTSRTLNITLQLPDSVAYRKTLFGRFSASAKRWLAMASKSSPMELETLLQIYLSSPCDDDLNHEPHIGHALALEIGNSIKYGTTSSMSIDPISSAVVALPPNSAPFAYRVGLRNYLRGYIGQGEASVDTHRLKQTLADYYMFSRDNPGRPLPGKDTAMRELIENMHQATYQLVATPKVDRELARLLVWVPLAIFDESLMRATTHMWTTLIVERTDIEVLLMTELTIAWTWLIQQHQGLFSQRFEPKNPFAAKMSYTPSDKSARSRGYEVISRALAPHTLLIEFLVQRFDSVKHLPDCNFNVINAILRILQVTFDNVDKLSTNALARGPLFILVHLGFKLLKMGFESSPILETKLREGLYRIAFRWFALPPRWSFSGSKTSLAKEIQILIDTRHTVKGDTPVLSTLSTGRNTGWTAATTTNPNIPNGGSDKEPQQQQQHKHSTLPGKGLSAIRHHINPLNLRHHHHHHSRSNSGSNQQHSHKHNTSRSHVSQLTGASGSTSATSLNFNDSNPEDTVLNIPRDQLIERARRNQSLLLLLLESEICRMATWANPTDQKIGFFPDVSRFARNAEMTEQGWQNLVVDAWVADPRLAVRLIQRFSHPTVRRELTGLICKFPGELVRDPDALPLLIEQLRIGTASSVTSWSGTGVSGAAAAAVNLSIDSISGVVSSGNAAALAGGLFGNLLSPLSFREQKFLLYWSAVPPITSTSYLASSYARNPLTLQYAMRSLECFPVDVTFFYIPQLVQALREDTSGYVERAIISSAQISQHFAHQIIWNMKANMYKDEDSRVPDSLKPTLDRIVDHIVDGLSGDDRVYYEKEFEFFGKVTGISGKLKPYIKKSKAEKKRKIDEEMRKIEVEPGVYLPSNPDGTVVDIDYNSGRPLQSHAKAPFMATFVINRPPAAGDEVQELLKGSESTVTPPGLTEDGDDEGLSSSSASASNRPGEASSASQILPAIKETPPLLGEQRGKRQPTFTDTQRNLSPEYLSTRLSKAKVKTYRTHSSGISDAPDLIGIPSSASPEARALHSTISNTKSRSQTPHMPSSSQAATSAEEDKDVDMNEEAVYRLSAIFKVGDDCRQDVLALQLIAVFKNIFTSCGLDLYLYPYRVVATAPGCGVIDVIPNSISRDQMGREKVNSLSDYFATKYHGVDSIQYQQARSNFVQSLAAYSVLSYLLQFKDRHNGNIMLDSQGHIVHIDFGFILDIAPGGITFESAPFKLTTEYIQVMGGSQEAQPYRLFCELCIKAYLASRPHAEKIIEIVSLMLGSGLPCFKGETTLAKLRSRFQLDKTERDAAQFMADRIYDSYENKRTVLYDQFQKATNGIPY